MGQPTKSSGGGCGFWSSREEWPELEAESGD